MTLQHQKDTQGEASLRINEVGSGVRRSDRIQDLATQMALLGVVENIQSVVLDTLRASHSPIDATIGGALNTSVTEGSTLVSSEELYSRVVANLEASKSQILSKLSEKWQSSTTQFLEQFHDDGLAERGCAACSQLNQSIEPSSALYSSGISSVSYTHLTLPTR